ncbi:MAG: hypothetical protein BAJALOKI3v1_1120001 [Promethearchaeota archaeon]|nr:MAG: hypothetical protein BAJALOKI3v1_1120001 [Candidatus Lokiarchaeota archaeon]
MSYIIINKNFDLVVLILIIYRFEKIMTKVSLRCPECGKNGYIEVSEEELSNVSRGLLAVNVSENIICNHSFVAYVDKNLKIRDCFMADFHIEIPELVSTQTVEAEEISKADKIDLVLIKLNLPATLIAYLLKSILLGQDILILNDQAYLYEHIQEFIEYITENSFDANFKIIPREDYINNKKEYKNYIILEGNEIVNDKDNILSDKKLNVERTIVEKFLAESDERSSLIVLKNEIQKSYSLAEKVIEFINNYKGKEIQSKKIIDYLAKEENVNIKIPYLRYLLDIVEHYFKMDVPISSDISNFLGFL